MVSASAARALTRENWLYVRRILAPNPADFSTARELGHESEAMVRKVDAHLGTIRHRAEVVEFRVEQHLERLGDRLQ
jgi:hypothetical protein